MKLPVRSLRVPFSFQRDRLRFFGRSTLLNLHETGITLEGMVPDVYYPILMGLLWRAVSNWTIRTIPFSRIVKCKLNRHARLRWLILTLTLLISVCVLVALWEYRWLVSAIIIALAAAQYLLLGWVLKSSVEIEYLTNSSKPCAIRLRFRSAADEQRWFEELSRHRLETAAPTLAQAAKKVTSRKSVWRRVFGKGVKV